MSVTNESATGEMVTSSHIRSITQFLIYILIVCRQLFSWLKLLSLIWDYKLSVIYACIEIVSDFDLP